VTAVSAAISGGSWPDGPARVARALIEAGAEARLHEFAEGTPTAETAADAIGCLVEQVVKSLVFLCDASPTLVMVPGGSRADAEKVRRETGAEAARIARPELVLEVTGFEVGGVAPFPLPGVAQALVDRSLLRHEIVWAGAGSRRHMVGLAPAELCRLTRARAGDLVADTA
jgi:prolyl-tRNA editing enzyme YbaK/EbsC (Cys-tRNA(Pro) deacylase)